MMAVLALWLASAVAETPRLDLLPPQALPPGQCAMALWDLTSRARIAMVSEVGMNLVLDGAALLLKAEVALTGLPPEARYTDGKVSARYQLSLDPDSARRNGVVTEGVLAVRRADGTELVMPVSGLVGCG